MNTYGRSHLTDQTLLRDVATHLATERGATAVVLADLAEIDARKLYLPQGYPSTSDYCVGELGMTNEMAYKRIRAARTARQFPLVFGALADGRLDLTAVVLLAPRLTDVNAEDLVAAAAGKSKLEIKQLLVERSPRPDVPTRVLAIVPPADLLDPLDSNPVGARERSQPADDAVEPARVTPLSPQRFALQLTIGQGTLEKLRYAQALLGHQVPSQDVAEVLDRGLDALIAKLEKQKFAATARPRSGRGCRTDGRHIPAQVKRTVWERDGGQCTFLSETGRRCCARTRLEFDHIQEFARGGRATVEGIRLRCRAHNQYEAERTFGADFMKEKREQARRAREACAQTVAGEPPTEAAATEARPVTVAPDFVKDVFGGLRELGFRAEDARRAAELSARLQCTTLEERMRAALMFLGRKPKQGRVGTGEGVLSSSAQRDNAHVTASTDNSSAA